MKPNYTHISLLIDRSGSMGKLSAETITGVNSFLHDQKKIEGTATVSLATFASDYTLVQDFAALNDVKDLTTDTYKAAGYTSLLYSLGRIIYETGVKLAAMKEEDRPSKVILVAITDGEENNSHNVRGHSYTKECVAAMIKHQTDAYKWEVIFLGASLEQINDAKSISIAAGNTLRYTADSAGVGAAYSSINSNMKRFRRGETTAGRFFDNGSAPQPIVIPDPGIKVDGSKVK